MRIDGPVAGTGHLHGTKRGPDEHDRQIKEEKSYNGKNVQEECLNGFHEKGMKTGGGIQRFLFLPCSGLLLGPQISTEGRITCTTCIFFLLGFLQKGHDLGQMNESRVHAKFSRRHDQVQQAPTCRAIQAEI